MIYKETTTQEITYSFEDIINWVKTFAARQLNITSDEIKTEDIKITPEDLKDVNITVKYTKNSSNVKEENQNSGFTGAELQT